MSDSGSESAGAVAAPSSAELVDLRAFINYIRKSVGSLLELQSVESDAAKIDLRAFDLAFQNDANATESVRKFIAEPQTHTLLVSRWTMAREELDSESGEISATESDIDSERAQYSISNDVQFGSTKASSIAFIKRGIVIEADKSPGSQIRVILLSEGSPYETFHSYISTVVAPYFKSYIKETGKAGAGTGGEREGDKMAGAVEKKLTELEMGLLHLQQNIEIPEVVLTAHPLVQQIIKRAAGEGRRPKVDDFPREKIEDSSFLNQLQNGVNRWVREIMKVTKLDRDPASGTALQEISFWLHLERALLRIQEKRESPEITLTMDCLKQGKRFHAVVSFDTDTGLKQALDTVHDYAPLMKDFPINDLLAAVELDKIRSSIAAIFSHMRKIRNTRYPIKRALRLVEAISSDLQNQLLKVLGSQKLMHIPYEEFDKVMSGCFEVFQCWDDEYEKLQTLLRDLMKKKRDEQMKMVWRIAPVHKKLQARLDQMRKFRQRHEQLRTVIVRVLRPGMTGGGVDMGESMSQSMMHSAVQEPGAFDSADQNAIDDVNVAYDNVKEVDCLDLNPVGIEVWDAAMKRYEERIDRVEARITARLRDQLGTAKNANEMFRIFSRFNALFIRPHIRGAIREYQTQLIQRVKEDIEALHSQFKIQYIESKSDEMSGGRDLPPVSGSIVWAKQIDRQLTAYLRRVEDVLGKGWESHIDGQKLKADGDSFRAKLNTQPIFDDWAARVQSRNLGVSGRIFGVEQERRRKDGKPQLKLKVNFQLEIITLAKEVRNLKTLGFRVPLAIVNKAHQANQLYPFAISLIESVKSYQSVGERLEAKTNLHLLVAGMKKEVQAHISEGSGLVWESYKLEPFVQKFADCITNYQEKVEELLLVDEQLCLQLSSIDSCEYTATTFTEILQTIQKAVDSLSLQQYSNLPIWVQRLDEEIERKLAFRLQEALRAFTKAICGSKDNAEDMDTTDEPANRPGGNPLVQKLNHEMRIVQQVMYLCPSIEEARENLLNQLFQYEAVILAQERISHSRYQVGLEKESLTNQSYRGVLAKLPDGQSAIEEAYNGVENIMNSVKNYVGEWLRYQALWDLQPDMLYERLGDDLSKWMKTLVEIKKSRATFDTTETKQEFGPMIIDYAKVQSKVSLKYDSWHKEVLQKFGTFLGTNMSDFYTNIAKSRGDLEMQSVDASSTSEAVALITYVQGIKRKMKNWEEQVEMFKEGQRVLERQRFQFPQTWLHSDNVEGEWSAFSEILRRKDGAIQTQVSTLQSKIVQEDKLVENKTNDLLTEWDSAKPTGNMRPDQAAAALAAFEAKFAKVKTDRDNIIKAKEALELTEPGHVTGVDTHMEAALEEMADLRGVWNALKGVWEQVDEVKEKPWLSVQPRKLRQQIDGLLTQLKELPANYRNYDSFEYVKKMLQGYAKVNLMIVELKSEALKERHWKQLMKQLNVNWVLNDLTLGQVWDADLLKYDSAVREVMLVAQGEMALEEFMKQVREAWTNYELELISYQNKTKLIRGWDDLFTKLKEHINSVGAMKLSPYYKEFEEDAVAWDDKLNRINTLFDVWIDVQRRWVYLEGIFSGSADIKTLLPQETSKFQSICAEFLGLMKKVAASPRVMDVLSIPGVQKMLERLADLLQKIQKALGEYLERERSSFPRFYFVGDEDLLEIIGNTKNIPRLQKHFKKMFAGVTSILLNDDNNLVNGICSRENEEVKFIKPVSIKEYPKINDWLTQVEREMRSTLAQMLAQSMSDMQKFKKGSINPAEYMQWLDRYPAQIILLSVQISWSEDTDACLAKGGGKLLETEVLTGVKETLGMLADSVLQEQPIIRRKKLEQLIMEYVHKRDVTRELAKGNVDSNKSFAWLKHMRFYFDPNQADVLQQLSVQVANAKFNYGFEYLGVQDRLVQTPLTDRCYLTMTQALEARLGGSPFGPAGTGKTESVKMLGSQLGRFVLVFNCDEAFDFQAMGRIFVGLCQVGAWGCFDEFNRLEERMLSACSQQIQVIQECMGEIKLKGESPVIELIGKQLKVNPDMAIFITMNPGYAGRANLPDNLKQLFRSLAMTAPDRQLIAQVSLFSQGFRQAEKLASKAVPFFQLCLEQLSSQSHYDFGLRALKSVLASAGNVKRERIQQVKDEAIQRGEEVDEATIAKNLPEQEIVIQSLCETMVPKLVAEDIPLMFSLLSDVFPGVSYDRGEMKRLREEIRKVCEEQHLCYSDNEDELGYLWVEKVLQLYQITCLHHGLMMVGPSGAGKSTAWRTLLTALQRIDGIEGVSHVIDPKAMSKDHLYGWLDPNTREWTDGLFTHILRKIIDNVRGEINKRQWIIFDGDVDPGWVENLNSVLDESKLFTLPNGERLALPPNVRIMFEVENLKYATLATVSRCGMVWFSDDVVTNGMSMSNFIQRLRCIPLDELEAAQMPGIGKPKNASPTADAIDVAASPNMQVQNDAANLLERHFGVDGIVTKCLEFAEENCDHIMDFTNQRALGALYSMMNQAVRQIQNYNSTHLDFGLSADLCEKYLLKQLLVCCIWSFAGDGKLKWRADLSDFIRRSSTVAMPSQDEQALIDFEVSIEDGEWKPWINRVPQVEIETHKVAAPDVVIPTVDTVRHESMLYAWLADHKPMLLCGPPGSGKTMTLFSALRGLSDMEVVGLNFSSATTPELLLKTFDHYCEYRRTPNGLVLAPIQINKWLVLFCDEINLPDQDDYGTQRVISFLRQIVEQHGFYRTSDRQWVHMERIQFVGACNPPTDPGRKPLSHRFLRHVPVIYVDYPGEISLKQIYGTFNRAMLRIIPALRNYAEPLTNAMVELYLSSQERFTQDMQPHYVYSPRELTRWVRGICEAIRPLDALTVEGLVRLWAHEALRLFQDRLITDDERKWTDEQVDAVAERHFPGVDMVAAIGRPILYSCWLTKHYLPVEREELREYVKARLKVFYEEELDVPLVLFNEVLDHVLRIDRIFRQPQGHVLLIGVSGSGKTTLSRFVAWMNGFSVFQVKVHNRYTALDFDEDLRICLRRSGCRGEKIAFIMDESNVLDSSFLERMNTLLANGEVPGLFEGDEYTTLMTQVKEAALREGMMLDSTEELYKWFTEQVCRNLHVVFTMNPSSEGLKDKAATSPALFNRCVLNWTGDWSDGALFQVGHEFTTQLDLERTEYTAPDYFPYSCESVPRPPTYRDAILNAFVHVHQSLHKANAKLAKRNQRTAAITPRHYLDFIGHYVKLFHEKREELEEQQLHLNVGLQKIRDTQEQVLEMQKSLSVKEKELEAKNTAANAKLKQMLADQQQAEKEKAQGEKIQEQLKVQQAEMAVKKADVQKDLDEVEPAVQEAQEAVKGIQKSNLVEIRTMTSPPAPVRLAMESICLLLGDDTTDWKQIRAITAKDDFINRILNFDTDTITPQIRKKMKSVYINNEAYTYEKIQRASKACGPMVKWAIAQLSYSDMLNRVDPLRNELKELQTKAAENETKATETQKLISELEKSIGQYKDEYAELIGQAEVIKADLSTVKSKVDRSIELLRSLGGERERWEQTSEAFRSQMSTIVGDVLVSAAFLAYAGYFDQHMRQTLFNNWSHHLQACGIQYRQDMARVEYLSNPDERLRWQANELPSDDLCAENAIMLNRFNRYPLVIDPSGQAINFLMNEMKDKKLTRTSFLDSAFRKNLESALRFGNPLLVQDVESYDPILNPVLNREVKRTGGRVLITLGDQDIDLSPTFRIYLAARDPTVEFPADICSRVTFVNFTVTKSSLQSQCLNRVLKAERPDVDQKRSDLLKLQGEFALKIRHLEKSLLRVLNDSQGSILENDSVISALETLKKEAAEVSRKAAETDMIMNEVEQTSQQYMPLSTACASIYFTLEQLNQIHFLYQYSLQFFMDIFSTILHNNPHLEGVTDYKKRLQILTNDLFQTVYNRVSRGMLHEDRITFAILLARIYIRGVAEEGNYESEFNHLLRGGDSLTVVSEVPADYQLSGLSNEQAQALYRLCTSVKQFNGLGFTTWVNSGTPERSVPELCDDSDSKSTIGQAVDRLLVIQALRPDRFLSACHMFVDNVMGSDFMPNAEKVLDLGQVVENEVGCMNPILLCAVTGYDASGRIDDLAAELGKGLTSIAIGSAEGFNDADKAINSSVKSGRWVMLKNVHLAPSWLVQLEKKLHSVQPHASFRLFLTMEIHPKIPVNLLRAGRILVFEPPPGVKANLERTFSQISANRMGKAPAERARLYFILAWLHAIVQERLRYAPLGWSKKYEFSEADLRFSCDMLDTWLDNAAMNRANLPPDKIPFAAIQTLLSDCIYGGRIDNEFDQRLLSAFVNKLFSDASFVDGCTLVADLDGQGTKLAMPEGSRREQFVQWTEAIKQLQVPTWLGLPHNAEKVLLTDRAREIARHLLHMQQIEEDEAANVSELGDTTTDGGQEATKKLLQMSALDDDEELYEPTTPNADAKPSSDRPQWMQQLSLASRQWLKLLPRELKILKRTLENIRDPFYRFFEREVTLGKKILMDVRRDLEDVVLICQGSKKQTNHHRTLIEKLSKGILPDTWRRYTVPQGVTVIQWVADFSERVKQLQQISEVVVQQGAKGLKNIKVWLGGLFVPEAYVTATRQWIAQANEWALEELTLQVAFADAKGKLDLDDCSFGVTGLRLMGAKCVSGGGNMLELCDDIYTECPLTALSWRRNAAPPKNAVTLPVYLHPTRQNLLFTLDFETSGAGVTSNVFYERGVAVICTTALG